MSRKTLSKSDIKKLNQELEEAYGISPFSKKDNIILIEEDYEYLEVNGDILFFYQDEHLIPTLKHILKNNFLPTITVDMGAVKFVASGADVMRPGIVKISKGIKKDSLVCIIDEKNSTPLALGRAQFDSEEMEQQSSGKVIKSVHYVGDALWKL